MMRRFPFVVPAILSALLAQPARAQTITPVSREPLKIGPVAVKMRPVCPPAVTQAAVPTESQRREARDMAQRARQSAILGDAPAELSALRGAAGLDPTDPNLAYELARAYDAAGAASNAAAEYCRFVSLAPNAPEAAEARERAATLAPPKPDTLVTPAGAALKRGTDAYDKGEMYGAEVFFNAALKADSNFAEAYYDRAVVRSMIGKRDGAADDFARYLHLRPDAGDRAGIAARINELRRARLSSAQAFELGIVVPGGGQFYTKRPGRGILSLAAVGGAVVWASTSKETTTTTIQTALDPFGNSYTYSVSTPHHSHPYVVPGLSIAAGIALISAIDASHYARNSGGQQVLVGVAPTDGGVMLAARIAIP